MAYGNKIRKLFCQDQFGKEHRYIVCMDGTVLPQSLWRSEQKDIRGILVENFKPQTVNLRLQGINKYLEFTKQEKLKVKFVKVQQKTFWENVISDADYKFLKTRLKADRYDKWYFIVWFMAATGARISELLHIKAEHVYIGHLDLYSKGGKIRRLYIPKNLRTEATQWLKEKGLTTGYIFLNRFGKRITTRGI